MPTETMKRTPRQLGYRMPAEWEPHEATWLAWPHNPEDWPGKFASIPWLYAEIIRLLAARERVHLIVEDAATEKRVKSMLQRAGASIDQVSFHRWPTDRGWTRDSGPIFVRNAKGQVALTNWRFNAWAKYDDWRLDDKLPGRVEKLLGLPEWQPCVDDESDASRRIVLEGGSIDVNGRGTLLTTEECLLSKVQQRNPGMTRKDYERVFAEYLGAPHTIWLGCGISGDDTHGHVDDLTRFVSADSVVTMVENNPKDVNQKPLRDNLRRLRAASDQRGKPLNIVELPMPGPVVFEERRLPASYANFYIANGVVLAPVFDDPNDRIALNTLATLFPTRDVVPIYSGDLIWGLGTMHCMTQQQPAP